MATISENLTTIKNSVDSIKQAIIDKGGVIDGDISTWSNAITNLSGGSSFKITNKLNGKLFGGPSYNNKNELIHTYQFDGDVADFFITSDSSYISSIVGSGSEAEIFYDYYSDDYLNNLNVVIHMSLGTNYVTENISSGNVSANRYGDICFWASTSSSGEFNPLKIVVYAFDKYGNYDTDYFYTQCGDPNCFIKDTKISLSDKTTKYAQDITYNDELLVWNFDEGKYDSAKPLWIKKEEISSYYYKCILNDGTVINLVGSNGKCHRLFCIEDGMFTYATDMIGKTTYTLSGRQKVVSCEKVEEVCEYYNIITKYHINLFADGILTSCRYNNIYPIKDMKFVKDDRLNRAPKWKIYEQFRDHSVLYKYHDDLRLYEQLDIPLEETIKYCERLESNRKKLDDFEENKVMVADIDDSEVGWIDRSGKVYGFKLYMPGQHNHIILADKICQKLGFQTDNPSRYLEKKGWVKYNTDFILNSDDEYINKDQLSTIRKFIKVPGKLKNEGYIKIGSSRSTPTNIQDFENMDEYGFEMRKRMDQSKYRR